ncbi:hypothetical protein Tsp_11526 [Trichinella spiralis]|uniref:hypothetical protein n=1 Tax=Trichinella spiralis TaxID=6334 RepID=UPI0001EFE31D|nr:hypothetical protein Tsp_11526 [Trichinella spiralis]
MDFYEEAANMAGCARFSCRHNPAKVVKDREQRRQARLLWAESCIFLSVGTSVGVSFSFLSFLQCGKYNAMALIDVKCFPHKLHAKLTLSAWCVQCVTKRAKTASLCLHFWQMNRPG